MTKSILANLKLAEKPQIHPTDPIVGRRNKMLVRLQEQRDSAIAMIDGKVYETYKEKIVEKDGEKVKTQVAKRFKTWYYRHNNAWHFEVRYGNIILELAKGCQAIVVGDVKNLVPTIDQVIAAAQAGEFDEILKGFSKDAGE